METAVAKKNKLKGGKNLGLVLVLKELSLREQWAILIMCFDDNIALDHSFGL